jgi:uncharacterized membrane protein HdeD (DUF308 family)
MEEKRKAAKTVPPTVILWCLFLVMSGFFYFRFPFVHPHRQYTRELYLFGNIISCIIFINLLALFFLILGFLSIALQLFMDRLRLETDLSGWILMMAAAAFGVLAALTAFIGFFSGRSIHDYLLSFGILFLLCVNLVLPEFTKPYGYKSQICPSRLKTLCIAFKYYAEETSGKYPNPSKWCDTLHQEWDVELKYFLCPDDSFGPCSYAMNENIPADVNDLPGDLVLLFESAPGWNQTGGPDDVVTNRHNKNDPGIAFVDGHIEFVPVDKIPSLRWTIKTPMPADAAK